MGLVIKGRPGWVGSSREGVTGLIFRGISYVLCETEVPNLFDTGFVKDNFFTDGGGGGEGGGNAFGMIQVHCIYCALYFYYYCVSSTSDHQALDRRHWGLLV